MSFINRTLALLVLFFVFTIGGCDAFKESKEDLEFEIAFLTAQIVGEMGSREADSIDQCSSLKFGWVACGGEFYHEVYSTKVSDAQKLQSLAERHVDATKRYLYNHVSGLSECDRPWSVTLELKDGICVDGRNRSHIFPRH